MKTPYDTTVEHEWIDTIDGWTVLFSEWSDRSFTIHISQRSVSGLIDTLHDHEKVWDEPPGDDAIREIIEGVLEERWDSAHA